MNETDSTATSRVTLHVTDGIAVVTMVDSARRNVLAPDMVEQLEAAFDSAEADDSVRCVVLASTGPAFCAGAQLEVLEASAAGDFSGIEDVYRGFLRVLECALPTIAVVNGPAVGAGLNLALACDVRVATRAARFESRFMQLRLLPGGGHTWLLERSVGREVATAMLVFGQKLVGEEALAAGLVWRLCDSNDEALVAAMDLGRHLGGVSPQFVRTLARVARRAPLLPSHAEALELERFSQRWSTAQPEFLDGVRRMRRAVQHSG